MVRLPPPLTRFAIPLLIVPPPLTVMTPLFPTSKVVSVLLTLITPVDELTPPLKVSRALLVSVPPFVKLTSKAVPF